ncbi:MAG: NAD-dependent epimerase/dehydratase family protein [candidate division Zixibacteria bacterium]|nr:NAD-dependent epimerase/dehydratase family protein [candidate division Zixibacteria bacterium]
MDFKGITLVTGAAGFIGRYVVEHLVALGARVRATDLPRKDTSYFDNMGVEFVAADLTKPETLPALFDGGVDRVFHLGAICNFSTPYERLYPINVLGVDRITRLALDAGVMRYIHVGSTSVYGPYRGTPFTEDAPRNPQDSYGRSKRDGEDIVWRRIAEGLAATITRPCTVYGPGCTDGAGKVFSRRTSITAIPGSGRQLLSNVRAEDVAAAVVHLSHLDEAVGKAFNIAEDSHPTLEEALTIAARTFGARPPRLHLPIALVKAFARMDGFISKVKGRTPDLEYDAVRYLGSDYVVDNSALKATGYEFIHPNFEESMKQLGEWYKE